MNKPVEASFAFEYWSLDSSSSGMSLDRQVYRALFRDNDDGEGSVIPTMSILRIRVKREEVRFYNIRFELNTQRQQVLMGWTSIGSTQGEDNA